MRTTFDRDDHLVAIKMESHANIYFSLSARMDVTKHFRLGNFRSGSTMALNAIDQMLELVTSLRHFRRTFESSYDEWQDSTSKYVFNIYYSSRDSFSIRTTVDTTIFRFIVPSILASEPQRVLSVQPSENPTKRHRIGQSIFGLRTRPSARWPYNGHSKSSCTTLSGRIPDPEMLLSASC